MPSEGYADDAPELADYLPTATARERAIWLQLWTTPQACAWSQEAWRWPVVADLVMYRARADDPDAPASLATAVRQLREDLGLSKSGLAANGWAIAQDEIGAKRAGRPEQPKPQRRLRSADAQ